MPDPKSFYCFYYFFPILSCQCFFQFREHWSVPLVIQMHHMGMLIKQLNTDLKKKTEQIKELTPDSKNNSKYYEI